MSLQEDYYQDVLRPVISRQPWLLFNEHVIGLNGVATQLRALGAERPMLMGALLGTGEPPNPDEFEIVLLGGADKPEDISHSFHLFESSLSSLPADIAERVNSWDPENKAMSAGMIVLGDVPHVAGRRHYGRRDPRWASLEDKVRIDAFWDRCGVQRAPSMIVSADIDSLSTRDKTA